MSSLALLFAAAAQAVPFSTDISVTSRNWFDDNFASGELTSPATQSGSISLTNAGTITTSPYTGATIGTNPLTGVPTDVGDGFGMAGVSSASDSGTFGIGIGSLTDPLQTFLRFVNNSASATYHVSLAIALSNAVSASGADAYSSSEFSLSRDTNEFFFSDLMSDTVNGNEVGGIAQAGSGGLLTDIRSASYGFDLAPGANTRVSGYWTLRGGAFANTSAASSDFSASVTISEVRSLAAPPPPPAGLPLPGTLALLVPAIGALAWARRERCLA